MSRSAVVLLTLITMLAFAGNSLLCRLALKHTALDAASFTAIRLFAGALTLIVLMRLTRGRSQIAGSWWSAAALFAYAALFSFSYLSLSAGTGALLLFGAVQATMIAVGIWRGERLLPVQWLGLGLAIAGLIGLMAPGVTAPPLAGGLAMLGSGVAWGIYSLRGKGAGDPGLMTCGNFVRSLPFAALLLLLMAGTLHWDAAGAVYAVASGALASGLGYWLWYRVLPMLRAVTAATVQLSVPVITAIAGVLLLAEPLSWRLALASLVILGGIALVIRTPALQR